MKYEERTKETVSYNLKSGLFQARTYLRIEIRLRILHYLLRQALNTPYHQYMQPMLLPSLLEVHYLFCFYLRQRYLRVMQISFTGIEPTALKY